MARAGKAIVFVLLAAFALAERAASTPVADPHRRHDTSDAQ